MNCLICNKELNGKGRFMSWLADGQERGPFCVNCTPTALIQMEIMEVGGPELQRAYIEKLLGGGLMSAADVPTQSGTKTQ
jgi:hypothetical protein